MLKSSRDSFYEESDFNSGPRLIIEESSTTNPTTSTAMFLEPSNSIAESPLIHHDDETEPEIEPNFVKLKEAGDDGNSSDGTVILNGDETDIETESENESSPMKKNNNDTTSINNSNNNNNNNDNNTVKPSDVVSSASGEMSTFIESEETNKTGKKSRSKFSNKGRELTSEQRNYIYGFHDAINIYQKQVELYFDKVLIDIQNDKKFTGMKTKIKNLVKLPKFTIQNQADSCHCNQSTFKTTLEKRNVRLNGKSLKRSGPTSRKIPEEVGLQAIEFMKHNPGLKRKNIMEKFGITANPRTFKTFLKNHNFTYRGPDGKLV